MSRFQRLTRLIGVGRTSEVEVPSLSITILDAGTFDHPSYLPIKALEDALVAQGFDRIDSSSPIERFWSRLIIRFDLTRFFLRLSWRIYFVAVMNLPARRFYPQGWWSESIVYCFDCWSGRYDEWETFLRKNRIKVAFFSARDAARELSRRLPEYKIAWMPEAIDAGAYVPDKPLQERGIDLLEFGRGWPRYHDQITDHCQTAGYVHLYPTDGRLLFPIQKDLYRGLADAKLVVCVPQSLSHPEIAGNTETMSLRYLEVIASGGIPLGKCPLEMIDLFGYDPVVSIDEIDPTGQLDDLLGNIEILVNLRARNLEALLRVATWECRARDIINELSAKKYLANSHAGRSSWLSVDIEKGIL